VSSESINKTIQRLVLSPYHKDGFVEREKEMFQSLGLTPVEENGEILISNTLFDFKKADPSLFKNTQLIIHPNSGFDNFPVEFVREADFPIIVGNPIRAEAVAEYSISSLFQNFAQIPQHKEWQPGRHWNRPLLSKLNILIIGFGHIGRLIHHSFKGLGANPDLYDPEKELHTLEGPYDAIIMACSLNPTSRHMINQGFLEKYMKPSGCLINGARGKLVEQESLKEFAQSNSHFAAYLDVFEKEPEGLAYFKDMQNITTTSHIAGVSDSLDDLMISFEKKILEHWLSAGNFEENCPELVLKNRIRSLDGTDFLI